MDGPTMSAESASTSLTASADAPSAVFQPPRLKDVIEVIDLMSTVASRVREDKSSDLPAAAGAGSGRGSSQTGTSTRDDAIAAVPATVVMQKKLVEHLEKEITRVEKQARALSRSNSRGSAHALAELYKKIRRLTSIISDILEASAEMIKRFYVSVFIDHQPLVVTGGTLKEDK